MGHGLRHCTDLCKLLTIFSAAMCLLLIASGILQLLVEKCMKKKVSRSAYFLHRILILCGGLLSGWN